MRICLVYDCLYPHTVGGAERWYRDLAERLAGEGHDVTYVTRRQWARGERVRIDARVRVVVAAPRVGLYTASGRRRILTPLLFGAGVLWHLLRHGARYDVVHTCSFPYFPLLAAAAVRPLRGYALVVDWFEVWSREYWRGYLGGAAGLVGAAVQRLCARVPQRAFCFSELHARRLREEGLEGGSPTVLRGLLPRAPARVEGLGEGPRAADGEPVVRAPARVEEAPTGPAAGTGPLVLFAGRLIPEKRVTLGVAGVALAARRVEGLRGVFYGEGPEKAALDAAIREHGAEGIVTAPGWAAAEQLERDMRGALCVLLPSRREGYGLVVVEAAALGTPSVVVAAPDNAAVELVADGVNGLVVLEDTPQAVAEAIVRVHELGQGLRASTERWWAQNADALSLESSLKAVLESYEGGRVQAEGVCAKPRARA